MKGSGKYFDRLRNYLSNINIRSWYPSWPWKKTAKTKQETTSTPAPHATSEHNHEAHSRPKHEAHLEPKEEILKHIEKNKEPNTSTAEDIAVLPKRTVHNETHVDTLSQQHILLNIILSQHDESDHMYIEVNPSDRISTLHKEIEHRLKTMYVESKKSPEQNFHDQKPIKTKNWHRLILYFNDQELKNDKTISHYNLKENSKIYAYKQTTSSSWG